MAVTPGGKATADLRATDEEGALAEAAAVVKEWAKNMTPAYREAMTWSVVAPAASR